MKVRNMIKLKYVPKTKATNDPDTRQGYPEFCHLLVKDF